MGESSSMPLDRIARNAPSRFTDSIIWKSSSSTCAGSALERKSSSTWRANSPRSPFGASRLPSPCSLTKASKARADRQNQAGTRKPRAVMRARLAALPPPSAWKRARLSLLVKVVIMPLPCRFQPCVQRNRPHVQSQRNGCPVLDNFVSVRREDQQRQQRSQDALKRPQHSLQPKPKRAQS